MKNHFKKAVFLAVNAAVASVLLGSAGVASAAWMYCYNTATCTTNTLNIASNEKVTGFADCRNAQNNGGGGAQVKMISLDKVETFDVGAGLLSLTIVKSATTNGKPSDVKVEVNCKTQTDKATAYIQTERR